MQFIFLSPHLDDAVLSCGGILWELVQRGDVVEVWTVFAGDASLPLSDYAQSLHRRWAVDENGMQVRREEDLAACRVLGVTARHFPFRDVIYRRFTDGTPVVRRDEDLFQSPHPQELSLIDAVHSQLLERCPSGAVIVVPLTLGGHVDHRLVRAAAERLPNERWYYADFPYITLHGLTDDRFVESNWKVRKIEVSDCGLSAWQQAVACFRSQISTFWEDAGSMSAELQNYWSAGGGQRLLQPAPSG